MKKMTLILTALVLTLTLGLGGCSNTAPTSDGGAASPQANQSVQPAPSGERIKVRVGWTPPDVTGVFKTATDYMEKAVEDAAAYGIDVEIITRSSTSHTNAADQVKTIENFIQNNVDVIIVSPAEVEAIKAALRQVNEAKIPLIVVNMLDEIEGIEVASFIGFDNAAAAAVAAYSMLDALGGPGVLGEGEKWDVPKDTMMDLAWWQEQYKDVDKNSISGKIAIIEGIAGDFFSNERNKGFKSVTDQFPNIEIVTTLPADWNRQKGVEAAENILQNNKELDGIFASSNEMGMGAYIAVKSAGRENEVIVVTQDGTPESVDSIRAGNLMAETWHGFPEWGWYGIKFAVMTALGQEIPEKFDVRPRTEYVANADNFYPTPALEPIDWQAIVENAK